MKQDIKVALDLLSISKDQLKPEELIDLKKWYKTLDYGDFNSMPLEAQVGMFSQISIIQEKINKKKFNIIKTIKLINKYNLLQKIYSDKYEKFKFVTLIQNAKYNTITNTELETLKDIYESIILISDKYLKAYNNLKEVRRKIPTRYGKNQIINDIQEQGGVPTENQTTMLMLAELETLKNKIAYRGTSDHYNGTTKISPDEHQKIQSAITNFKEELKTILNK